MSHKIVEDKDLNLVVEHYNQTQSIRKTAVAFNCSLRTIANYLNKLGVDRVQKRNCFQPIYTCQENIFETIDTEEKAYWLGFITADGCIHKSPKCTSYGVGIALNANDKDHLEKFKQFIQGTMPIHVGTYDNRYRATIHITSKKMGEDLINLGVGPLKTYNAQPCKLPKNLLRHYYRGLVDGDGWVVFYPKKVKTGTTRAVIGLSGTEKICCGFQKFILVSGIPTTARVLRNNPKNTQNNWLFQIGGAQQAKKVCRLLYENSTIHLDRKEKTANLILEYEASKDSC